MSGDRRVGAIRKTRHLLKLGVGYLGSILPPFPYFEYVSKFHIKKKLNSYFLFTQKLVMLLLDFLNVCIIVLH